MVESKKRRSFFAPVFTRDKIGGNDQHIFNCDSDHLATVPIIGCNHLTWNVTTYPQHGTSRKIVTSLAVGHASWMENGVAKSIHFLTWLCSVAQETSWMAKMPGFSSRGHAFQQRDQPPHTRVATCIDCPETKLQDLLLLLLRTLLRLACGMQTELRVM